MIKHVAIAALLTMVAGCARPLSIPRSHRDAAAPPSGEDAGVFQGEEAGVSVKGAEDSVRVPVMFGTDREVTGLTQPGYFFSGDRDNELHLGRAVVTIPRSHKPGELETPQWWRFWNREAADEFVLLASIEVFAESAFAQAANAALLHANSSDVLLFVHGYANTFEDAARRTAQIAYDLKWPGLIALYSWPSEGDFTKYTVDEASVSATTVHLRDFLNILRKKTGATRLNLVAHSMGSRALLETLALFAQDVTADGGAFIQHLVFAAPDVDAQRFSNLITQVRPHCKNITLYASSNDKALKVSAGIHGAQIAGQTVPQPLVIKGVHTIDASAAHTDFLAHSYVGQADIVDDMFYMFRTGYDEPGTRARMFLESNTSGAYWKYR